MKHKVTKKLDRLAVELFGRNASDCVLKGVCVSCSQRVRKKDFAPGDVLGQNILEEYIESGLCPHCIEDLYSGAVFKYIKLSTSYTQLPLKEIESLAIRRKKK